MVENPYPAISTNLVELAKEVDEKFDSYKSKRTSLESNWFLNLAYFLGQQWVSYRGATGRLQAVGGPSWRSRVVINRILPFVRVTESQILKQEPQLRVFPSTKDEESIKASRVADKVLLSLWQSLKMTKVMHRLYKSVIVFGDGFLKPYFNKNAGQEYERVEMTMDPITGGETPVLDDFGRPVISKWRDGEVEVDVITPLEWYPDPAGTDHESLKSGIQAHQRSIDDLEIQYGIRLPEETGVEFVPITHEISSLLGSQQSRENMSGMVLVKEYWEVPSARFPKGRHIVVANNTVLEYSTIPEEYLSLKPALPYIKFSMIDVPHRYFAKSPIEDARPIQRQLNKALSQMVEYKNMMGAPKWMIPEQCQLTPGTITTEPGQNVTYLWGPWGPPVASRVEPIPSSLLAVIQEFQKMLDEVLGTHEISYGKTPRGVRSGQAIAQLQDQDMSQIASVMDDLKENMENYGKMLLNIVRLNFSEPRTLKIVGKDSVEHVRDFTGSSINDVEDPTVELGSSLPQNKIARVQVVKEHMAMGLYTPEQARKALEIEGDEIVSEDRLDEAKAKIEIEEMKAAKIVEVDPFDDPIVHIRVIESFMKTEAYKELPDAIKQVMSLHRMSHIEAMSNPAMTSPLFQMKMAQMAPQQSAPSAPGGSPSG